MHYEINVSLNGEHFFATHERSLRSASETEKVYKELQKRFPEKDGFKLTCTGYQTLGHKVEFK